MKGNRCTARRVGMTMTASRAKIHVVDDDADILAALQAMYKRYGVHSCTEIKMAGDAIAKAVGEQGRKAKP